MGRGLQNRRRRGNHQGSLEGGGGSVRKSIVRRGWYAGTNNEGKEDRNVPEVSSLHSIWPPRGVGKYWRIQTQTDCLVAELSNSHRNKERRGGIARELRGKTCARLVVKKIVGKGYPETRGS